LAIRESAYARSAAWNIIPIKEKSSKLHDLRGFYSFLVSFCTRTALHIGCGQSLATNALMNQLEKRILQTDQLKNASKCLQHR